MLMVSASSLLSLFLIIEGLVAVMYVLTAGNFLETSYPVLISLKFRSTEGALKYLITNAIAGSFFLLGSVFLLYSANGEIYFSNLHLLLLPSNINSLPFLSQVGILLGLLCIALTFLFKAGSFPFYSWMVDLYESANLGILSFFILIPKMAILLTIINLQRFLFYHFPVVFASLFLVCGLLSLVGGAVLALKQNKINRLVAYSSVSQIGSFLVLLSFIILSSDISYLLPMLFVVSYSFIMLQFMSILIGIKKLPFLSSPTLLLDLSFVKNLPVSIQTLFATFIFNLAGIPPFLGWLLKAMVVFTSIFLSFDIFFHFGVNDARVLSTLSSFELSFLTFLRENILDIKTSFFSLNLSFSFFIILSILVFLALTTSVYYSLQIYKVIFSESKNISVVCSTKTLTYYTSILLGSTIFVLFFFNIFLLLSICDIFIWTVFLCFF
jgi:NADH-quinone oxidoreductase subunit N